MSTARFSVALAAVAAAIAAPALAERAATPTAPAALVGKWTRVVTEADRKRGGGLGSPAGRWTMTIERSTGLTFGGPRGFFSGNVDVHGSRIHFVAGGPGPNSYAWSRTGNKLTFRRIVDADSDRRTVVVGTWTRAA